MDLLTRSPSREPSNLNHPRLIALTLADEGLATIEYVIVLVAVSLGVAAAILALGPQLATSFASQTATLGLPFP